MELSLLILVCIHKSYIVYLEIYVVPIGHGFSLFGHGKVMEINVEKERAPWQLHRASSSIDPLVLFYWPPSSYNAWPNQYHAIYEDRIWQTQFPRCCTQNMELFTATSPFTNHQPTTVQIWAQNSSLQTRLHMTFTSENYWGVNLLTYLLTYRLYVELTDSSPAHKRQT